MDVGIHAIQTVACCVVHAEQQICSTMPFCFTARLAMSNGQACEQNHVVESRVTGRTDRRLVVSGQHVCDKQLPDVADVQLACHKP